MGARIEAAGRRAATRRLDLADLHDVVRVGDELAGDYAPRVLVNNAGEAYRRRLADVDPGGAERLLRVNTLAPLLLARGLAGALASHREPGSIVNVSSVGAVRGSVEGSPYAVSKAALHGLTTALAVELAPSVRVNAVVPGVFDTEMNAGKLADPEVSARASAAIPLGRAGAAEDCADVVAFLASDRSRYVTGAMIPVDGGLAARLALE